MKRLWSSWVIGVSTGIWLSLLVRGIWDHFGGDWIPIIAVFLLVLSLFSGLIVSILESVK